MAGGVAPATSPPLIIESRQASGAAQAVSPPQSASILSFGPSSELGEAGVLLYKHRDGNWTDTGGEVDEPSDPSRRYTAVRELMEEHYDVSDPRQATLALSRFEESGALTGPYGATVVNSGYLLACTDADAMKASFVPNYELVDVRLVPLRCITGSDRQAFEQLPSGEKLPMRHHLGYQRVSAAKQLVASASAEAIAPSTAPPGGDAAASHGRRPSGVLALDSPQSVGLGTPRLKSALRVPSQADPALKRRKTRFEVPMDVRGTAAQVVADRRASFAHRPSADVRIVPGVRPAARGDQRYEWPTGRVGLNCQGGSRRAGDIQSHAEAAGQHCVTPDLNGSGYWRTDLDTDEGWGKVEGHVGQFAWGHFQPACWSWSAATCIPPGGLDGPDREPLGPYRSPSEPDGVGWLPPILRLRVEASTRELQWTVRWSWRIHNGGGSVSIEGSPDARLPGSPGYLSRGEYTSGSQFPMWNHPLMADYIAGTGSIVVTVPMCGALDCPYLAWRGWCLNPRAKRRATRLERMKCCGNKHTAMSGWDEHGVSHGERAQRYSPNLGGIVFSVHMGDSDDEAEAAPEDGGVADVPVDTARDAGAALLQLASSGGETRAGEAREQLAAGQLQPSHERGSLLTLVLMMAASCTVALLPGGELASTLVDVANTAAGREAMMGSAKQMLGLYGAASTSSALFMAGALPDAGRRHYVVAGFVDEPYTLGPLATYPATRHAGRPLIALALASAERLLGIARSAPVRVAASAVFGSSSMEAVALPPQEAALEQRSDALSRRRYEEGKAALYQEAAKCQASDPEGAAYLLEVMRGMAPEPFAEVPLAGEGEVQPAEDWMLTEPYRTREPLATEPLPVPQPQPSPGARTNPTSVRQMHNAEFMMDLATWWQQAVDWLLAVLDKVVPLPRRPGFFVRGQTCAFKPEYRNCVWDNRRAGEGIIEPCDFTARPVTDFRTEWMRGKLVDYVDQEAASHMCDGADLKGGIALQYCFSEHLLSLADDYMTCHDDLVTLRDAGFCAWFDQLPFSPWRCNGQGLRGKGSGWRRIASGSAPYDEMTDTDGVSTCSINEDSRKPDQYVRPGEGFKRWRRAMLAVLVLLALGGVVRSVRPALGYRCRRFRKEWKPRVSHAMHDTAVQRSIADKVGLGVYYFSDDFKQVRPRASLRASRGSQA